MSARIEQYTARRCGNIVERPLEPGVVYLWGCEGETDPPFAALFLCPCGCGGEVSLPLTNGHPAWKFNGDLAAPTFSPSVLWTCGCKSHFFIRRGRVEWC